MPFATVTVNVNGIHCEIIETEIQESRGGLLQKPMETRTKKYERSNFRKKTIQSRHRPRNCAQLDEISKDKTSRPPSRVWALQDKIRKKIKKHQSRDQHFLYQQSQVGDWTFYYSCRVV